MLTMFVSVLLAVAGERFNRVVPRIVYTGGPLLPSPIHSSLLSLHPPLSTPPSAPSLPLFPTADFQIAQRGTRREIWVFGSLAGEGFNASRNAGKALRSSSGRHEELSSAAAAISSERLAAVLKLTLQTSAADKTLACFTSFSSSLVFVYALRCNTYTLCCYLRSEGIVCAYKHHI